MSQKLTWIVPGDPDQRTGGYLYDARIVAELRKLGWQVSVIGLAGRFPDPDSSARQSMTDALGEAADGSSVVIDGLALGGLPDVVAAHAGRLDITALVHHPLADETGLEPQTRDRFLGLERQALAACRRVIVTSPFTSRRLLELALHDHPAAVVEPGVDPADPADSVVKRLKGNNKAAGERLLCVATLTPRKGQDVLVQALAALGDRSWHCDLVGSTDRDPLFAEQVQRLIESSGLSDQVRLTGELDMRALNQRYQQASICVLPSHYEGYGMVVTEAMARGLPLITTRGGALADTLPPGCGLQVAAGDAQQLSDAIKRWLDEPDLRLELTRRASQARAQLSGWQYAGRAFATALAA